MLGRKHPFPALLGRDPFPASGLGFPSLAAVPRTLCTSPLGIWPVLCGLTGASGLRKVLSQGICPLDCKLLYKCSLHSVLILLCVPILQMVCGFLQKASEKLTSPESSEFTR